MVKRLVSLLVGLFILSGMLYAKTSTVDAKFILDKTKVNSTDSSRVVNLTVLGLDSSGKVDLYGEQYGSTLYVVVTSDLGTVNVGGANPGAAAAGSFATSVKYVSMTQGVAKINISYPKNVSGTDTINIQLMEMAPTEGGGNTYNLIASTTKTVTVEAGVGSVKYLTYVTGSDTSATAGQAGATITYIATGKGGANLSGSCPNDTVTLYFLKQSDLSTYKTLTTTLSDNTSDCVATFVLDNTFTTSGTYYLEAKDGDVSSIGCATLTKPSVPTFTISALSIPTSLTLGAAYGITKYGDNGSSGYSTVTLKAYLKDKYGNKYSPGANDNYTVKLINNAGDTVKTGYTNGANFVTFSLDGYTDIKSTTTTSVYATVPSSDITNSDTVSFTKKTYKLVDNTSDAADGSFDTSAMKLTGTIAIDNNSNATYDAGDDTNVGSLTIELYDPNNNNKLVETVNTTTNASGQFVAFFSKVVKGTTCTYVFKDANGSYVPLVKANSTNCPTKNNANIKSVKIVDLLHRESSCSSTAAYDSTNKVSVFKFYPYWLAFYDANGNLISDNYTAIYADTGFQVKATTAVTATVTPSNFDNLSGGTYDNITIVYDPTKYSSDNITFSFFDNQSNISSITKEITIQGATSLGSLKINVEQTTLPVNSTVAFTVEAFDTDGKPYSAKNIVLKIDDSNDINPTIKESDTTQRFNNYVWGTFGSRKLFTVTALKSGSFTITFQSADGSVKASKTFTISAVYEKPACSADNLSACTTQSDCENAGGSWDNTTNTCSSSQATCDANHLDLCTTESDCTGAGGVWDSTTNKCSAQTTSNEYTIELEAGQPTAPTKTLSVTASDNVTIKPTLTIATGDSPKAYYLLLTDGPNWFVWTGGLNFALFDGTNLNPVDSSSYTVSGDKVTFDLYQGSLEGASGASYDVWFGYKVGDTPKYNAFTLEIK